MTRRWIEIPVDFGASLWSAYRVQMYPDGAAGFVSVHAVETREGFAMTEVGLRCGDTLLRLETTYEIESYMTEGCDYPLVRRINEVTHYFLPATENDDD